jgi:hypothetical protein
MTTTPVTLGAGYFDGMYQAAADPWGFEDRWYERRKYAIGLALLPAERYRAAFEPGCSIGVLTRMLAPRCGTLLSCDLAAHPGLGRLAVHAEPDFLAEVYIRTEGTPASVAQAAGLV